MARGTVNKVLLIGRLGSDPEVRHTPSGAMVANFSLATNRFGSKEEATTDWHRITVWRKTAEIAQEYLKKGMRVFVEGRIQYRDWQDQNGVKRYQTDIIAERIEILESAGERQAKIADEEPPTIDTPPEEEAGTDDSVPF